MTYIKPGDIYCYSKSEMSFFRWTTISVILGLIYPVINNGSTITNLVSLICTLSAIFAIVLYLITKGRLTRLTRFFGWTAVYMIVVGVIGGSLFVDKSTMLMSISQDWRYIALFFLGGIYATDDRMMAYFHHIMHTIAIISIVMGVFAVVLIVQNGSIIMRGSDDQMSYHLWWTSTVGFAYCGLYYFLSEKKDRLFLFAFLTYFIIGMSFLKRSCFLNCIIIALLSVFLSSKLGRGKRTIAIVVMALLVFFALIIMIPNLNMLVFDALFQRFSDTANDIKEFDRLIEFNVFNEQMTVKQKITGLGVGNFLSYNRYGLINGEDTLLNALHLGYGNIIYKGGVVYALFYIVTYFKLFGNWFRSKHYNTNYLVCFGVSISALISLFYEGSWTYTIGPFCISAPIFYAAIHTGDQKTDQ